MRRQTQGSILLLGLLAFVALLGSLAPASAQRKPQFDVTPVAYVYLPLVEANTASQSESPTPTPTFTVTPTPTSTPTSTATPTMTPTSYPAPPTLIAPSSGVVLTQPVGLNDWLFHWDARTGPCHSLFDADGPNGYSLNALVNYQTSSPGPYSYHYTRTEPFPAEAFGWWVWRALVVCPLGSAQSQARTFYLESDAPTPTPTPTSAVTPTPTSTAKAGPPVLVAPANGAVLLLPINGNEWLFRWDARMGPCHSSFNANGPNGYSISAQVYYQTSWPSPYTYHYTRTTPFPAEALGWWTWHATVICPLQSAQSETRAFYFDGPAPAPP